MNGKVVYFALSFTMLLWGSNIPIIKIIVTELPAISSTALRIFAAGLFVFIYTRLTEGFSKMNRQEWFLLIWAALLGVFAHQFFLAIGLEKTSGTNTSLILALNPLTTALLAFFILKHKITWIRAVGIVLGFSGITLIVLRGSDVGSFFSVHIGDFYIFLAMLVQSLSFLFIRRLSETVPVNQITALQIFLGSLLLFPAAYMTEGLNPREFVSLLSWQLFVLIIISGVVSSAIGSIIWNQGIRAIGPAQTAIFGNMMPIYGVLGSVLFLDEVLTWKHVTGFSLILLGVFLGSGWYEWWRHHSREKRALKLKRSKGLNA